MSLQICSIWSSVNAAPAFLQVPAIHWIGAQVSDKSYLIAIAETYMDTTAPIGRQIITAH
jgi:hypothetical protein